MQPVTLSKVLSHVTLHPLMKTFTQWHQFLHVLIRTRKMSFQVPYQKERIFSLSSDQQPRFILINKFFQQFSITGLQNVSSTNFEYGQIHHNLRIHFGIHHDALHECFIHHDVLNHFFIHHDVLNQFFVHHDVLVTFASFSNPSESSDLFDMSNSQRIHLIHFSWDLRHLLLDAAPKLLRCNDFFVHSSRGMHPKQKFVRRHQHDLSSAQVRTPANFESPLAGYARATHGSEDADAFGASCSNRTVFLNLSCCSSLAASGSLWLTWTSLILFLVVLAFYDVTARCVRLSNRHLLIICVPAFLRHIPCTSLNSSSSLFFHSLCLCDSVLACINRCFSRQGFLKYRSGSLAEFILTWFCRFSLRCKQRVSRTTSHRQDVESTLNL